MILMSINNTTNGNSHGLFMCCYVCFVFRKKTSIKFSSFWFISLYFFYSLLLSSDSTWWVHKWETVRMYVRRAAFGMSWATDFWAAFFFSFTAFVSPSCSLPPLSLSLFLFRMVADFCHLKLNCCCDLPIQIIILRPYTFSNGSSLNHFCSWLFSKCLMVTCIFRQNPSNGNTQSMPNLMVIFQIS